MKQLTDQIGTSHFLESTPRRIVSLVPSQTELLFDLGLEDQIVGITKFCVHPKHLLTTKKIVGGTKQVHFDKIKALQPDIIICNKEENTLEMVQELSAIAPVWVTNVVTIADNFQMITDFGLLFDTTGEAKILNESIHLALADFTTFIATIPTQNAVYFIWKKPYMIAGSGTFINELLQLNRFDNFFGTQSRYPEIAVDASTRFDAVDLVLLSSEPYPFKNEDVTEFTSFFPNAKILLVDGEYFSWHGSRLLKAISYFKLFHQTILTE
ncbi:cobalamin-binding protein [Flavobacterium sp. LM5]|uniref:ABC transporter substrate-binding protein n=1 Tax=Flavobacterium sp. LM5 TaxID=1938610 RepID=UPI0009946AF4|nr:helical backbone metal receptor [Flavobacterium sp. LM5]OOV27612.1 cobalamin-binding protein [Flavobacterium sp. LM5]